MSSPTTDDCVEEETYHTNSNSMQQFNFINQTSNIANPNLAAHRRVTAIASPLSPFE